MRNLVIILLFFVFIFSIGKKYDRIFNQSYYKAIDFIKQNQEKFDQELGHDSKVRIEKISIVFPEIIKYSLYKDILETTALEIIYVNYGKEQADFSIGYFQMKPSFIEKLEHKIYDSNFLFSKYHDLVSFKDSSKKKKRKERIVRLKSIEWQLKYLNCFYDHLSEQYKDHVWRNPESKIRFFSTAYNHDFEADKREIEYWINKKVFPYGLVKGKQQYAYCDIAVFYFKNQLIN